MQVPLRTHKVATDQVSADTNVCGVDVPWSLLALKRGPRDSVNTPTVYRALSAGLLLH